MVNFTKNTLIVKEMNTHRYRPNKSIKPYQDIQYTSGWMVEGFHITCMRIGKYDKNHFDEYIQDILKKMPDSVCFKAIGYMNNLPLVQKWENKNPVFDENGKKVMVKNHGLKLQLMICPDNDSQKEAARIFDDIYAKYSKTETNGMEFKNFKSKLAL